MTYILTEDQEMLQATMHEMLARHCDSRRVHAIIDARAPRDEDLWKKLIEFGIAGAAIPQEFGGLGLGLRELVLLAEELGAAAAPANFLGQVLAAIAIAECGSDAQKATCLPKLASGEVDATIALGEGDDGWDPSRWTLRPSERVSSRKDYVPGADVAKLFIVGCREGLGLVTAGDGVTIEALETVDFTRPLGRLTLDNVRVEPLGDGSAAAVRRVLDAGSILLAADAFGGASRCVAMAVDYSKTREQFGVPIASFQGLRYQLVQLALDTEPGRGLIWHAARAWDLGEPDSPLAAATAKAHMTDRYLQVARDTIEAHGGIGYTWDHDAHIYLKRAMFDFAVLGAPSAHRKRMADLSGW